MLGYQMLLSCVQKAFQTERKRPSWKYLPMHSYFALLARQMRQRQRRCCVLAGGVCGYGCGCAFVSFGCCRVSGARQAQASTPRGLFETFFHFLSETVSVSFGSSSTFVVEACAGEQVQPTQKRLVTGDGWNLAAAAKKVTAEAMLRAPSVVPLEMWCW